MKKKNLSIMISVAMLSAIILSGCGASTARNVSETAEKTASEISKELEDFSDKLNKKNETKAASETEEKEEEQTDEEEVTPEDGQQDTEEISEETDEESEENADDSSEGIRPEFKKAMDDYEDFYDKYCKLLKDYQNNPTDMKLMADYMEALGKAEELDKSFEAWDGNLNNEELKYYLEVQTRVQKKMIDIM